MPSPNCLVSPETDDALVERPLPDGWSMEERASFQGLLDIKAEKRAAVVVTMRDDGVSILEWVAHYRALGFDGIFIYSNDNVDGSEQLLMALAGHGVITFIDNRTNGHVSPQRKAFEHSIRRLAALRQFEWVFYADSDEFLELPTYQQRIGAVIDDLEMRFPKRRPSAICYRWKWFLSGYAYKRSSGPLLSRFRHARGHALFKSVVRLQDVVSMQRLHFPDLREPNFVVDASLTPLPGSREPNNIWKFMEAPKDYTHGSIRHYWCKSFQEFLVKKQRGEALKMPNNIYIRDFDTFFDWNGQETNDLRDPVSTELLDSVGREITHLMQLPGVADLHRRIEDGFVRLLKPFGGDAGLRLIYEEHMRRRGLLNSAGDCAPP